MLRNSLRVAGSLLAFCLFSIHLAAQNMAAPIPQKLTIHSNVLNEDRVVWVRTPQNYERTKAPFPVLYLVDGPTHINLVGSTMDFLVQGNRMPPLVIVGIANTDRTRDMTPSHADEKNADGTVHADPTSGGADHFIDFIQNELMPEIERRYRVAPYKIFAGHSLGGLLAIHILITRPDMFQAYIAASPSLWWDNQSTLHRAQDFFAAHAVLNKTLFLDLGNEGPQMRSPFDALVKTLTDKAPKDFRWKSAIYPDEDHGSSVLRGYYDGLREVFLDWRTPSDADGRIIGGLQGLEAHYHELSSRYGYEIPPTENAINNLGYQLLGEKKVADAIVAFKRNVELYPASANVYDSLGDGYEADNKLDLATENVQKAVDVGTKTEDPNLEAYKEHLKRLIAKTSASGKVGAPARN
jgi:predicted alpha/beta superfamily hydrolase